MPIFVLHFCPVLESESYIPFAINCHILHHAAPQAFVKFFKHSIPSLQIRDELVDLLPLAHPSFNDGLDFFIPGLGLLIFLYQPIIAFLVFFLVLYDPGIFSDAVFHHARSTA